MHLNLNPRWGVMGFGALSPPWFSTTYVLVGVAFWCQDKRRKQCATHQQALRACIERR